MNMIPIAETSRRSFAAFVTGYDIFVSFALGSPPRGVLGYALDLSRRLREKVIAVFLSEEQGLAGHPLTSSLRKALRKSRILLVIANREMLEDPRCVRTEVEEFRRLHPNRPIISINIDGALQDKLLDPIRLIFRLLSVMT